MPPTAPGDARDGGFATTHWSLVLRARGRDPAARAALGELARAYWYPVYAYFRRTAGSANRAEDLTQGLFAHLLGRDALAGVDPARGRFRSFLLACCEHFRLNERARAAARKRGGGTRPLSLDVAGAEARDRAEPADTQTAERLDARSWALDVLAAALRDVEDEYRAGRDAALFDRLQPTLTAGGEAPAYAAVAAECGMTLAAVKKAAQRLRARYGAAIRRRVATTVAHPDGVEAEIRDLFDALANG